MVSGKSVGVSDLSLSAGGIIEMDNYSIKHRLNSRSEALDKLIAEGGDSFYRYVNLIGLVKDKDLIVLSAVHHYYFDKEELRKINTVINIKQLNSIKGIDVFLQSIVEIVDPETNFIGCFHNSQTQYDFANTNIISQYQAKNNIDPYENGIKSRIPLVNTVYNLMDAKTDLYLTRRNVSSLLTKHGFRVLDMTEINGLTYFHSQKPGELRN